MNNDLDDIRAERYSEIGLFVQSSASAVIDRWMNVSREEGDQVSAKSAHRAELRNHFPRFLEHLGAELAAHGNTRKDQRGASAKCHGEERWKLGWRLDEVIRDYQLLKVVLLDHLDHELPRKLQLEEIKAIGVLLDDAIEDAVTTYVTFQEQNIADTELQLRGTFENAAVGMAHVDEDGRWIRVNDRLCKMLGYKADELMQMPFEQFIQTDDAGRKNQLDQLLAGDLAYFVAQIQLVHQDGHTIWVNATASLQRTASQAPLYFILVIEDINERKLLDRVLEQARVAADESNRLKSEFVANVSHEIRTPMNAILGMTELALDEKISPELRDYIGTAHESAKSLLSLVNDLLDFSRIEAGKLELEATPFDLWEMIDETAKALSISASEKGLELLTDLSSSVPRYAKGDPLRLRQVITNLVSNAIKFTERGEVILRAVAQSDGSKADFVIRFSVIDTGIGISAEEKRRIFAPFTQADASTTRVFGGSGLGLAICTELIQHFGGKLDVESKPGEGSEFFFTARFERAEPPFELIEQRNDRMQQLRGSRILVVDDNTTNRAILEGILSQLSIEVDSFDNADAAINRLRMAAEANAPYDVVLVDALMPGRDGFSMIEEINSDSQLRSMTVLMLSSADRSTFMDRTADVEIDGFIDKPVSRRDLLQTLSTVRFGASTEVGERNDSGSSTIPTSLRVLVVEDTPANQKVVQAILRKRGHNVTLANNGREAIDRMCVESFNVVLMDVQMPTVDGYQATRAIREMEDESVSNIPIIAMTAHAMKGDADKCIEVGMNDYISKPIDSRRLVALVERWGGPEPGGSHAAKAKPPSEGTEHSQKASQETRGHVADFDAALARFDGNRKLLNDMMTFFREDVPKLLLELESGLKTGDVGLAKRSAHSIKGLAAGFDGFRVVELAQSIERLAGDNQVDAMTDRLPALRTAVAELESALDDFEKDR